MYVNSTPSGISYLQNWYNYPYGLSKDANSWRIFDSWIYDVNDARVVNTDTDMFQGEEDGVRIKQAGKYKFTCTMMYAMTNINNQTTGRVGDPWNGSQTISIASRFVRNSMINDHSDEYQGHPSYGTTHGFQQANPGPICVSPKMEWYMFETHRSASATWSCIIDCALNDVIKICLTRAGYAIDNCVAPQNGCNLLVEYIG